MAIITEKIFEKEKNDLCCFKELSKGDIFKVREGNYYYMRLNDNTVLEENYFINAVNLHTGSVIYFMGQAKVHPIKKVKITICE